MALDLRIIKKPAASRPGSVALFAVVRNEMYFLPHLLSHYRGLGVQEFWFLDDRSTDGTRDYLAAQPDCGLVKSNLGFADMVGSRRFPVAVKTAVPRALLQGRWVLTVDADEFVVLPTEYASVTELTAAMDRHGLRIARALMVDFFPESLQALDDAAPDAQPFALCPLFDKWSALEWPDGEDNVSRISVGDAVRPRMLARLNELGVDLGELMATYRTANVNKVPLLHWDKDTMMMSSHRSNVKSSDRVQLTLAHFKFYPGYRQRIDEALARNSHFQKSVEYRFLDVATRELRDWPLAGAQSRRYHSPADLAEAGLVYARLGPPG